MEVTAHLTEKARKDYLLVIRARDEGDQQAYAALLNTYRDSLYYLLLKMTRNPTDAEDLTIEAFGRAFRNLHLYKPDYAFSTWLFRIAANNAIDFLRRSKRIVFADNPYPGDEEREDCPSNIPESGKDPEELIIEKQKIRLVREVVEKLKPHYRYMI